MKSVLETHIWQTTPMHHFRGLDGAGREQIGHKAGENMSDVREGLVQGFKRSVAPWRLRVDGTRAVLDMVAVGVGYLL